MLENGLKKGVGGKGLRQSGSDEIFEVMGAGGRSVLPS